MIKVGALVVCFAAFTALGVWWAAPPGDVLARFGEELSGLGAANVLLLLLLAAFVLVMEMARLKVFGRVVGAPVSARAAFDASIANDLFTWITPGGLLGEPAAIWFMTKRGVPADAAVAITFAKFATSFALFIGLSAVLFAAGYGPAVANWAMFSIAFTIGFGVVLIGSFIVGAMAPRFALRVAAWIERKVWARAGALLARSIERLALFGRLGWLGWAALFASHIVYYASYVLLFAVIGFLFDARSVGEMIPVSIVYQAFAYIAPAPGIPEAGANVFFEHLFPAGQALVVVIIFRGLTAYVQVALGLAYLPVRGVADAILTRRKRPPPT
jgi:glycosyltransferase 2 family protein